MTKPFDVYVRRMNDQPWKYDGTFYSEHAYQKELPNLKELAVQRRNPFPHRVPTAGGAGTPAGSPQRIPAGDIRRQQVEIRRLAELRRKKNERT